MYKKNLEKLLAIQVLTIQDETRTHWYYSFEAATTYVHYTKDENPGKGALDLAMLFMMICPPFRLTTALPSGSESV